MNELENSSPNDGEYCENAVATCKESVVKKIIFYVALSLAGSIVLALASVVVVVAFFLGEIAEYVANRCGADVLGVEKFHVESLKFYPFSGVVELKNLEIGKPVGEGANFSRDLLRLEYFYADADVRSLETRKKTFSSIVLKNLTVAYEAPVSGQSNVDFFLQNLSRNFGAISQEDESGKAISFADIADWVASAFRESEKSDKNASGSANSETNTPSASNSETSPSAAEEDFFGARFIDVSGVNARVSYGRVPMPIPTISFKFEEGLGIDEDLTASEFGGKIAQRVANVLHGANFGIVGDAAEAAGGVVSGAAGTVADGIGIIFGGFKSDDKNEESK